MDEDDKPAIQLVDEKGITRLMIALGHKGMPAIIFKDEEDMKILCSPISLSASVKAARNRSSWNEISH